MRSSETAFRTKFGCAQSRFLILRRALLSPTLCFFEKKLTCPRPGRNRKRTGCASSATRRTVASIGTCAVLGGVCGSRAGGLALTALLVVFVKALLLSPGVRAHCDRPWRIRDDELLPSAATRVRPPCISAKRAHPPRLRLDLIVVRRLLLDWTFKWLDFLNNVPWRANYHPSTISRNMPTTPLRCGVAGSAAAGWFRPATDSSSLCGVRMLDVWRRDGVGE